MKKIENIDYRQNEWAVVYYDLTGEMNVDAVATWNDAVKRAEQLRSVDAPVLGVMTSRIYNAKIADE